MKIYHVTSAFVAQRLLVEPVFNSLSELNESSELKQSEPQGLHAYSFRKGYFLDQLTSNSGVKLVMEWTGKIERRQPFSTRYYEDDVLYVEYPWRCYIKRHTGQNLRLLGLLDDGSKHLSCQLGVNVAQGLMSKRDYVQYAKLKCASYLRKFWQNCKATQQFLQVGKPETSFKVMAPHIAKTLNERSQETHAAHSKVAQIPVELLDNVGDKDITDKVTPPLS